MGTEPIRGCTLEGCRARVAPEIAASHRLPGFYVLGATREVAVSLFEKYLSKLTPLITAEDETEAKACYREIPVEALFQWLQELETRRTAIPRQGSSHSEEYRIRLLGLQIDWMRSVLAENDVYLALLSRTPQEPGQSAPPERDGTDNPCKTALGRNINRLRRECGWTFNDLAKATDLDKKLILGHVNKGKGINPSTLRTYADAFSEKLGRSVTVAELTA
jgi:hypothetical protein